MPAVAVRQSGLVPEGSSGVAMVSGGPDSAGLAAGLVAALGPESVVALHLNYGLRADSGEDEAAARALCERLGAELVVVRPELGDGNVQAAARDARYAAAEDLRAARRLDWIATGHTRTDLAETVLYRLASSPGRRALLGLAPRRGRIVRPLLALTRDETRAAAIAAALPFRDDPSNDDPAFARARIRGDVLPALRDINPGVEENIAATWAELAEEADALEAAATEVLARAGDAPALGAGVLTDLHPAVRRLVLRAFAERRTGTSISLPASRAADIWRLLQTREGGQVDLGSGFRAICEAGHVRVAGPPQQPPQPVCLPVPGSCRFGDWELRSELLGLPSDPAGETADETAGETVGRIPDGERPEFAPRDAVRGDDPDVAVLDADSLERPLTVRAWEHGDRMRPLGLGGTKSLQDLFTDRRVPRSMRGGLPVVVDAGERIVWVAGVAVSDEVRITPATRRAVRLHAAAYTGAR